MKYLAEFRDQAAVGRLLEAIDASLTQPWTIMEVCGGQTHTFLKSGLLDMLPSRISLLHGPGCPVCVTPAEAIDHAIEIARRPEVIFCSFGDMARVPGSASSLLEAKAAGADLRLVYSPLDAVELAAANPGRQVVFFAVGFETTAPGNAVAVQLAAKKGLANFSLLVSHVRVPPAIEAILEAPDRTVQAFLAPGHVCTVMGFHEYHSIAARYRTPIVVTGFEPVDLLEGLRAAVRQLESGRAEVENQYARVVRESGNEAAQRCLEDVFEPAAQCWRGIGLLPASGLRLREAYRSFDAAIRFPAAQQAGPAESECISGLILQGRKKPHECPAFRVRCRPERPLGAPMVSSEGVCAAYYRYGRQD